MAEQYLIRRNFADILPFLDSIGTQADSERNALGFLPEAAYAEAAQQRKLILLLSQDQDKIGYVGHLLFGGMFPILRVRQIVVAARYRQQGHATTLLRALVAQAENEGYLNIVANVATDLNTANSFYERHGFLSTRVKAGGKTRNRTINVRILQLETPSLISYMVGPTQPKAIEVLQPTRRSPGVPVYAIDLNVFFDAIKQRVRSEDAGIVFEAALNHQIRIAASQERRIPVLPARENTEIESLAPIISGIVFPERTTQQRLKSTDKSDILHLAHAVAAGAVGYITSDAKVLAARDALMKQFKLDIIGLSEFVDLLDLPDDIDHLPTPKIARSFRLETPTLDAAIGFLQAEKLDLKPHLKEIATPNCRRLSVLDADGLIGVALLKASNALDQPSRCVVCVHQEHPFSSTVADFLISELVRYCSNRTAGRLLMIDIPSHPITRRIALGQGFQQIHGEALLAKIALGQAITKHSWNKIRLSIERLSGIKIQKTCPSYDKPEIELTTASGSASAVRLFDLETLLSPTILALPARKAVVVPITRSFAADLLGTDDQYSLLELPEAQFLTRRTYFNTTRAARAMIRGSAVAFYESFGGGGRGAVVAIGRVVDVTSIPAVNAPETLQRGAVVEDVGSLSKSSRVLATTFDNLVALKKPVSFETLRRIGCVTGANFASATPISDEHLTAIVDAGRIDE